MKIPCPLMPHPVPGRDDTRDFDVGIGTGNELGYVMPVFWIVPKAHEGLSARSLVRRQAVRRRLQEIMESDAELQRLFAEEHADRAPLRAERRKRFADAKMRLGV